MILPESSSQTEGRYYSPGSYENKKPLQNRGLKKESWERDEKAPEPAVIKGFFKLNESIIRLLRQQPAAIQQAVAREYSACLCDLLNSLAEFIRGDQPRDQDQRQQGWLKDSQGGRWGEIRRVDQNRRLRVEPATGILVLKWHTQKLNLSDPQSMCRVVKTMNAFFRGVAVGLLGSDDKLLHERLFLHEDDVQQMLSSEYDLPKRFVIGCNIADVEFTFQPGESGCDVLLRVLQAKFKGQVYALLGILQSEARTDSNLTAELDWYYGGNEICVRGFGRS